MARATVPVMLACYRGVAKRVISGGGARGGLRSGTVRHQAKEEPGMLAGLCDAILLR
jgi:hypothetical protein